MHSPGNAVFHRDLNKSYPIIDRGEGSYLIDIDGRKYLDASSGAVAANLGHSNPEIAKAIYEQAIKVGFVHSMRFETEVLHELSEMIVSMAPENLDRVYYTSGGSEANESALKLARQIHRDKGKAGKFINIGRWQSYHGNTMGSLSVGGDVTRRFPYMPLLNKTEHVDSPYYTHADSETQIHEENMRCLEQLKRKVKELGDESISALIIEPIVGSQQGGVVPTKEYLQGVRKICDEHDIIFIVDEVMTGFYRTGKPFAVQHFDVVPDIITFGKGVSAGYAPLGGMIVHNRLTEELLQYSNGKFIHGYTYSGHPISVAAGLATLKKYQSLNIQQLCNKNSDILVNRLKEIRANSTIMGSIRGKGLLLGVELLKNAVQTELFDPSFQASQKLNNYAMELGAIFYPGSGAIDGERGEHLIIAPPLNSTEEELDMLLQVFEQSIQKLEIEILQTN
ncbi:MAG TPA: aspartate aminotransferase family protein [Paenisporosarcina sp.]|nr:aspartate aminotransferase family protein [Paenisporosarcina sp.]